MAKYFIAYAYFIPNGSNGFGNIEAEAAALNVGHRQLEAI